MANTYTNIFRQGTYAQYLAITEKNSNLLYFCTDNGKLFKGSVDFTDNFISVTNTNLPATGVPGKIYYISDKNKWKTYIGSSYIDIGNPIDALGSNTSSTITSSSADDHVPSSKNVYKYGQEILSQAIGGGETVKNVSAGTGAGKINVTKGDGTSGEFTVPSVVASIANKVGTDAAFSVTPTTGNTYDVTISGVVTTPTWNTVNRILTLPVAGGSNVEVNIGKDLVLNSGYYDTTNKEIVLILNDEEETEIRIDATALIDVYTGSATNTASVSVSSNNVITANVKIDQATGNAIQVVTGTNGGLRVDLSNYALASNLEALANAATSWGTFT